MRDQCRMPQRRARARCGRQRLRQPRFGNVYATPSVSGIIALMMEANPDLSPMEIKEILKFTAERRGEPSAPEVDPYWNRDFGWGMVDARAAVEMSFMLLEQGTTGSIDVGAQAHLDNVSQTSSLVTLTDKHGRKALHCSPSVPRERRRVALGHLRRKPRRPASLERLTWTVALDPSALAQESRGRGSGAHRRRRL